MDATVTIFSPTFIESEARNARSPVTYNIYGKYQNTPMQSVQLHYEYIGPEPFTVCKGSATKDYAKNLVYLTISGFCLNNVYISLFMMGVSAYEAALDYYNAVNIVPASGDYISADIKYDCIKQWTYALLGDQKYLGLISQKSTTVSVELKLYFYNEVERRGKTCIIENEPNMPYESAHFSDPWETAYRHYGGHIDESDITAQLGPKTIHMNPSSKVT